MNAAYWVAAYMIGGLFTMGWSVGVESDTEAEFWLLMLVSATVGLPVFLFALCVVAYKHAACRIRRWRSRSHTQQTAAAVEGGR